MSDTAETAVDTLTVAKTFVSAVSKDAAYQAGVHVVATSIVLGTVYGVHQLLNRRAKKVPATVAE